jgi:Zn-dependent peptidase ImmA (M78 family)
MKLEPAFKRRCEAIAVDLRHNFQLRPFDPLPAEQLLNSLSGKAVTPDQTQNVPTESINHLNSHEDWSAGIIQLDPLLIMVHPNHLPERRQSDLMHELSHILLNHPMIGFSPDTGLPLRDARCEEEATYLGSCLQIPRLGLQWASQRGFTATQIAAHFGASLQMVTFRCNMTGIRVKSSPL